MVRVLAQTVRGVGLSPTWCYTFLPKLLPKEFILYYVTHWEIQVFR